MCTGFTLRHDPPRRPASYGDVERLHHHALVAGAPAPRSRNAGAPRRRRCAIDGSRRGAGTIAASTLEPRRQRLVDEVVAVERAARRRRTRRSADGRARHGVGAEAAHRVLEAAAGAPSSSTPIASPSSTRSSPGSARTGVDDLGQPVGDVVEVAGERRARRRRRGAPGCGRRRASTRPTPGRSSASASATSAAGGGQHRLHRPQRRAGRPRRAPPAPPASATAAAVARGRRASIAARRTDVDGTPAALRDGVGHHARRARPGAARRSSRRRREARPRRSVARSNRPAQRARGARPPSRRPASRPAASSASSTSSDRRATGVGAGGDVERRRACAQPTPMRPWRGAPVRNPTAADHLGRLEAAQQRGERGHLRRALRRGGDGRRGVRRRRRTGSSTPIERHHAEAGRNVIRGVEPRRPAMRLSMKLSYAGGFKEAVAAGRRPREGRPRHRVGGRGVQLRRHQPDGLPRGQDRAHPDRLRHRQRVLPHGRR